MSRAPLKTSLILSLGLGVPAALAGQNEQRPVTALPWAGVTLHPNRAAPVDALGNRVGEWHELAGSAADGLSPCTEWTFDSFDGQFFGPMGDIGPVGGDLCGLGVPATRWFLGPDYSVAQKFDDLSGVSMKHWGKPARRAALGLYFLGDGVTDLDPTTPELEQNLAVIVSTYEDWAGDGCLLPQQFLGGIVFEFDAVVAHADGYYTLDLDVCATSDLAWPMPTDGFGALYVALGTYAAPGLGPPYLLTGGQPMLWGSGTAGGTPCRNGVQDRFSLDDDLTFDPATTSCVLGNCRFGSVAPDGLFCPNPDLTGTLPVACECYDWAVGVCPDPLGAMIGFLVEPMNPCPCPGDLDGDCDTDQSDLGILLASYLSGSGGDLDGDGDTDQSDLGILLANYGCAGAAADIPQLIADLASFNPCVADAAYFALYDKGVPAIGPLIALAGDPGAPPTFAGTAWMRDDSSLLPMVPIEIIPLELVSLSLVDAIVLETPQPYLAPIVAGEFPPDPNLISQMVTAAYQQWWHDVQGAFGPNPTVQQLQQFPHALAADAAPAVFWTGPTKVDTAAPGSGTEKANSKTPFKTEGVVVVDGTGKPVGIASRPKKKGTGGINGPDAGADPDPYAMVYEPGTAGGRTPYNCLAWALNCQTDRWMQPTDNGVGDKWKDPLKDYGYDVDNPSNCTDKCPDGKGDKVKMVFVEVELNGKKVTFWVHAMKMEADGDWTSKNGQDSRWEDIKDCEKFLDKWYKANAPPGGTATRSVKCFCKK